MTGDELTTELPKISELDQAIKTLIGLSEAATPLGSRMLLHQQACLIAFENRLEGPLVDIVRVMLKYTNSGGGYPAECWDKPF